MSANTAPSEETASGTEPVEADSPPSTADLRRDAETTRDRLVVDVDELRHRLGLDADRQGPVGSIRRHPATVAVAVIGAATAVAITVKLLRDRRTAGNDYMKAVRRRRKAAAKQLSGARDSVFTAAAEMPGRGRKAMRRISG